MFRLLMILMLLLFSCDTDSTLVSPEQEMTTISSTFISPSKFESPYKSGINSSSGSPI